ncbi:MAG: hypothetical protein M1399_06060 [Actinobacteria bacterium]|nr:hypothetical protein [Actinomycetota bacterium]MCL5447448.1 hypothetical protein [Actinomycetota bacterium]
MSNVVSRKVRLLLLGASSVAFAAWEGGKPYTTTDAHVSVAVVIAVVVLVALYSGRHRQEMKSLAWLKGMGRSIRRYLSNPDVQGTGALVWLVFFMAYFGWDLNSFLHQQRDLPTLSYLIGRVTRYYTGRSVLVAGWLLGGWYLALGLLQTRGARLGDDLPADVSGHGGDNLAQWDSGGGGDSGGGVEQGGNVGDETV